MTQNLKAKVFISCGQSKGSEEVSIAGSVAERLKEKGFEPYIAVQEQSLRGLKENIFKEISSSEYFLFIDFKREQLSEAGLHRGSLFSHQELAIASFLDMPLLGFQEKGVKQDDGIIKFLQANCISFGDRHTLAHVVAGKIEQVGWRPDWKNQLIMERAVVFSDATIPKQGIARFFQISVRNLNPYKHARNCYAFLESIINLSTGESLPVNCVEFKWAGYILPNATILPTSARRIDGFFVFHDAPNTPEFNLFTDSGHFVPRLNGPGDYKLTYLVVSDNFKPIRSTFRMHLGNSLTEIRLEQEETNS